MLDISPRHVEALLTENLTYVSYHRPHRALHPTSRPARELIHEYAQAE